VYSRQDKERLNKIIPTDIKALKEFAHEKMVIIKKRIPELTTISNSYSTLVRAY
jgi:hypothetical protein